jgi:hypothetical protein
MRGAVQQEQVIRLDNLERLLNAAILLNGDVRLEATLQAAAAPMKTLMLTDF